MVAARLHFDGPRMTIRAMRSIKLLSAVAGVFILAGCGSSSETTEAPVRTRGDVMDLNDTPPAPIPPARSSAAPLPVEPAAAPETVSGPRKHVVAAKDTLYSLSKTYYGSGNQWQKIVAANPGLVPEKMPVGKTIIIP